MAKRDPKELSNNSSGLPTREDYKINIPDIINKFETDQTEAAHGRGTARAYAEAHAPRNDRVRPSKDTSTGMDLAPSPSPNIDKGMKTRPMNPHGVNKKRKIRREV